MAAPATDYTIAVLNRALDVLDRLAESPHPLGVTELARDLDSTKSAVFRILSNLERRGYVVREADAPRYQLGPRLLALGHRAGMTGDLRRQARPALEALQAAYGETVNLAVLHAGSVVYLDMVQSPHGLRTAAEVGARDPAHATALGKAMLAFLPPAARAEHLAPPLVARTPNTITDEAALARELARVRAAGWAEDNGENEAGARCFGAPIFDHRGWPRAAVSLSGPASRLDDQQAAAIRRSLVETARRITEEIGGSAPPPTIAESGGTACD